MTGAGVRETCRKGMRVEYRLKSPLLCSEKKKKNFPGASLSLPSSIQIHQRDHIILNDYSSSPIRSDHSFAQKTRAVTAAHYHRE